MATPSFLFGFQQPLLRFAFPAMSETARKCLLYLIVGTAGPYETQAFSSPELRSFWPAPRIETSGRDQSWKSANHGLRLLCAASEIWNNNGYHRLKKWAAIALARYPGPCQRSRSEALTTRIAASGDENETQVSQTISRCAERMRSNKRRRRPQV